MNINTMTFVAPNLACGKARGGRIPRSGSVTDEQRQPQAKFGATRRAAVLFRPDFVARSLQIHCGICSSLAPRLAEKSLAANVIVFMFMTTKPETRKARIAPVRAQKDFSRGHGSVFGLRISGFFPDFGFPAQALMKKRKGAKQSTPPVQRFRQQWGRWLAVGLVMAIAFAAWQVWRATAPPPPFVNTAGFDPVIAAAVAQARGAVQRAPRSAEARGRMGMVLLAHEVRAEARECFAQAAAFAPREPRWPYFLGLAQLVDNPMAAATNLDRAVRLFPQSQFAPRLKLADTLLSLGRLEEAEAHYRYVWQREPNSARAGLGLGKVANARDRLLEAANFLAVATQDPSTRKAAHRLLLNVNQRLGRTNQAEQLAHILPICRMTSRCRTRSSPRSSSSKLERPRGLTSEMSGLRPDAWPRPPGSWNRLCRLIRTRIAPWFSSGGHAGGSAMPPAPRPFWCGRLHWRPTSVEAQMQLGVTRLSRGRPKRPRPVSGQRSRLSPTSERRGSISGLASAERSTIAQSRWRPFAKPSG